MKLNLIKSVLQKEDGSKLSQYLAVLSASIVIFTAGLHTGWTSPSLKKVISSEYPIDVTEDEGSYIVIAGQAGHVLGGVLASTLADKIGRKWTILAMAFPQTLAFAMIYFSDKGKGLLFCARVAGGIGEGGSLSTLPSYIAEVADPDIRGMLGVLTTLTLMGGALFINVAGSYLDIHTAAAVCCIFPLLLWMTFTSMPDTPYYFLMKGKKEEATESLRILRRKRNVEKEILLLSCDVDRQMSESGNYSDLFTIDSNRKAFIMVSLARFFQQYTGCTAYGMYYQILIEQSTNFSPVLGSSLLILTQLTMTVLSSFFIDRLGRKPLLVLSSGVSFLVLMVLGTFFAMRDYASVDFSHLSWFPLLMMVVFTTFFSAGLGVALNILISEIYSTSIKAKALSLGSVVFASSMMSSTKFYQYTADNFGLAVPYYSFGLCTFFGILFFHYILPETKGKTLEAIQQELKGNVSKGSPSDDKV